jgi:glucosamine-6-phosphate deaminase
MKKIKVRIYPNETNELVEEVAQIFVSEIQTNNAKNRPTVLGLATGNTPLDVYRELIKLYKEGKVDFSNVITFNLDEYYELPPDHMNSYNRFMFDNLFSHINIKKENIHIPQGLISPDKVKEFCEAYEAAIKNAGGIDIQLLGIGRDGHIGFNEPLSPEDSLTRLVELNKITLNDAVREFGDVKLVPTKAITMGVKTIMNSKRVILIATGDHKAEIVRESVEMPPRSEVVASFLQNHSNAVFYVDEAAASQLTRIRKPWTVETVDWKDCCVQGRALNYLSYTTKKPIADLTEEDFKANSMEGLLKAIPFSELKDKTIKETNKKIMKELPSKSSILVFAPHAEDDAVGMGGTLQKLLENNKVACVYMTSDSCNVSDFEVEKFIMAKLSYSKHLNEKEESGIEKDQKLVDDISKHMKNKKESRFGLSDTAELATLKTVIREAEVATACNYFGITQWEFMNGASPEKVLNAINKYKPKYIFACGDMTDPNSAHRLCLTSILKAYNQLTDKDLPELWLYRIDSADYTPYEADIIIPLTEVEMERKIVGAMHHQSQSYKLQAEIKGLGKKIEER